jgi:hypothetical protein
MSCGSGDGGDDDDLSLARFDGRPSLARIRSVVCALRPPRRAKKYYWSTMTRSSRAINILPVFALLVESRPVSGPRRSGSAGGASRRRSSLAKLVSVPAAGATKDDVEQRELAGAALCGAISAPLAPARHSARPLSTLKFQTPLKRPCDDDRPSRRRSPKI